MAAQKNEVFVYEGVDKSGKKVKGEKSGATAAVVKAELRRQGINPLKVNKKTASLLSGLAGAGGKVQPSDISFFFRQLTTMMGSGVPLVQSFEIIGKGHENPAVRKLLSDIKADLEGGTTLADAMRRQPKHFDELSCNLTHAGEQAGILEDLLGKIATYKEKSESIKKKIKSALMYPTIVMVVAFVITAILMIFVIPMFAELFKGFGSELPALTQLVMQTSDVFVAYWWAIFGGIGAVGYSFATANKKIPAFNRGMQLISLKLPIFGNILTKAAIARFSRTLATMFAAGVPLVEAMESVAGAVGNIKYKEAVLKMRDDVATGTSLTQSVTESGIFPNMLVQMVAIGEESGSLDTMLNKVADYYEEEVDNAVDGLSSLMEPLIMAFLGGIIGTLVVAMYLPIFKMGEAV